MKMLRRIGTFTVLTLTAGLLLATPGQAQNDFSGDWPVVRAQDNTDNPHLGEFVGLPLSEEAIRRAEIWDAAIQSLPEWQCRPHSGAYIKRGPSNLKIWREVDPASRETVAFHTEWLRSVDTPIYMDGRPHPPEYAPHTWGGFQTGTWEGERLKITTTHLKEDYYRRNGVPQSDFATLTEYLIRRRFRDQDYLTWMIVAYDPVYLTEPLIRSTEYRYTPDNPIQPYPCTVVTEVFREVGDVPHHLPGANDGLTNFAENYGLPLDIYHDGADTMYPEYYHMLREAGYGTSQGVGRPDGGRR